MPVAFSAEKVARAARARRSGAKSAANDPRDFWTTGFERRPASPQSSKRAFRLLVDRVIASPGVALYDAVEAGVPTHLVDLIAGATGDAVTRVMDVVGVSQTTYRRKDDAGEPLPELGGKTPAQMLRNPEGQRAVEQLLERMRGGLPA